MTSTNNFFSCDYFALFGLPLSVEVNEKQLQARYQALQRTVHPDRFAAATAADKGAALQMASRVNEAYQTLRVPLRCAEYLLSLRGVQALAENNTIMSPDFLMQQLVWREALENAEGDEVEFSNLREEIQRAAVAAQHDTAAQLQNGDNAAAAETLRRWHYIQKMLDDMA